MIGMNVGIKDAGNLPIVTPRQVEIHLRVKRSIDHHSLLPRANEVGETAFAGAPHLDDAEVARGYRHFSSIPGRAPRLHTAVKRHRLKPSGSQLLGGDLAGFA